MIISYDKKINRKVRFFISSTFSDMMDERNIIVQSVFPRLRQEFGTRMVDIIEVDLRWGIPEDDSENGKILEICIGEVRHCAPFFIGIVGQRYGTATPMDAISNLPPAYRKAIGEDVFDGISITELEMRAGAFVPNNVDFSCFFIKEAFNDHRKLQPEVQELIRNIKTSYNTCIYSDLKIFEEQIYNNLREIIIRAIPEELDIPYNDNSYYSHLKILKSNIYRYIENTLFITNIERNLMEQRKLYIRGEKGIGKSACMSWIIKKEGVDNNKNVFFHFAAAGNQSLNVDNVFFRLRLYLQTLTGCKSSETENRSAVTELLSLLPKDQKLTLYFDAMDQLDDVTSIYQFFALASNINENIFVVCSGTEDYKLIAKKQTIEMKVLSKYQIGHILNGSLDNFGKRLDEKKKNMIINKESCSNPLFLKLFISQLRMYGTYETFDVFFNKLISASSFGEIFSIVIDRLKEYFFERNLEVSLVDKALALIVFSNNGVKEIELQEILNILPVARSVFFSAIELFTIEDSGLIRFNHDLIIQETRKILCKTGINYEVLVAEDFLNYFSNQSDNWRRYSEETFQLCKLNKVEELKKNLSRPECFMYLCRHEYHATVGYFSYLVNEQHSLLAMMIPLLNKLEMVKAAETFCQAGCHHAAIIIVKSLLEKENGPENRIHLLDILARSQYKLALNHFKTSIDTYNQLLSYYKSIYPDDKVGYAARAYLLGVAYKSSGRIDLASDILEKCADIYEKNKMQTATSAWIMDVYGESCYTCGNLKKALEALNKAIDICICLFGKSSTDLAWAYCYGWNTLYAAGDKAHAIKMILDAYNIYEQIYMGRGTKIAWASCNAGTAAMIMKEFEKAKKMYTFSIEENDCILPEQDRPHVYSITTYANLANLYERTGYHENAINTIKFALKESNAKNGEDHIYTANILLNFGILECDPNIISEAIKLYKQQTFKTPDIYFARMCLARILSLKRKEKEAVCEINACAEQYFALNPETSLITYLILETQEKICGSLSQSMLDKFDELFRFNDYEYYLTHNNNSHVIVIPSI